MYNSCMVRVEKREFDENFLDSHAPIKKLLRVDDI